MTRCPEPDELAVWLDRELPERRADEIRTHVATCTVCTARIGELERLIADVRAPAAGSSQPCRARVAGVMTRLDDPVPHDRKWARIGIGIGAFGVAAIALFVVFAPMDGDRGSFQSRGGAPTSSLEREVGTTLYAVGAPARRLVPGAKISGTTALVLGYRNLVRDHAVWALIFAVDADGETHWLYPGYDSAASDPEAVRLPTADQETLMIDAVVPDHPAAGPFRVIAVISDARLRVSAIEALRGGPRGSSATHGHRGSAELELAALRRKFPDAAISELALEMAP